MILCAYVFGEFICFVSMKKKWFTDFILFSVIISTHDKLRKKAKWMKKFKKWDFQSSRKPTFNSMVTINTFQSSSSFVHFLPYFSFSLASFQLTKLAHNIQARIQFSLTQVNSISKWDYFLFSYFFFLFSLCCQDFISFLRSLRVQISFFFVNNFFHLLFSFNL